MRTSTAVLGMFIALTAGYFLGHFVNPGGGSNESTAAVAGMAPDASVERYKVQIGKAPVIGPDTAKVTIVEFSDYQCPFCGRVEPTIDQIKRAYGKEVRIAFKHNPLPFHPNAAPAARAAMAAREQGDEKFWRFHEILFHNQDKLDDNHYIEFAGQAGLNVERFKADLQSNRARYDQQIQADQAEATKFGARGTPSFFINGRPFSGAQPFERFKAVIDEELVTADKLLKGGVPKDRLYASLIQNGKTETAQQDPSKQQPAPQAPQQPDPNTIYKVAVGDAPVRGPETAKVTIIEFSDFQCPFCSRVEPTISKVIDTYGKDVRVAFKQNPLPFHDKAMPAAEAAMAAKEQGKFWEMHDKLFANQQSLDRASFEKYAGEIGLNLERFKAALDSEKFKKQIEAEQAEAARFGARGTPSFFVNGKPLRGAQPFEQFKAVIDKEIELADAKLKSGVPASRLYAEIIKNGLDKVADQPAPAAQKPGQPEASDTAAYRALIEDAPIHGPHDAKVTIVYWSDFQCPFCKRAEPTVKQVMDAYPKDVRVAFKQLPLPFHNNAHLAAEASLAAKEQGKFWEMHDKLFENNTALERANLEKYAGEIGLNVDKFKAALDSGKFKAKVDEEQKEGNKIGAQGTPTFFINGKSLVGAQPFEAFKSKIDAAIKDAEAVMKSHRISAAHVYDEIMKDAKESKSAPAAAQGGDEGDDKTVYKVDPGNGPSWGDRGAPVTIVEFSDFQCPFCSRVLPTVKQIKEKYAGKVRIVWRNFPLPFHNNAPLAAEAAMAAHDQGKFWEMHDKLFGNQQALDRANLEKYAGEIGLNVDRFKADLDSGKWKSLVNGDVQYGNGLPGGGMGTPTFFINGRKLAGAYPFENFDKIISDELNKKK